MRVFISYAWENDVYRTLVKRLAARLRDDGIDARLDAWHLAGLTIPEFMSREVRHADKILVVCSPQYRQKVHAMEDSERITGTGWESMLVTSSIWANLSDRNKITPVLLRGTWKEAAPDVLIGLPYFDLSNMATFEANYRDLLRSLTGQNEPVPSLGRVPKIAPEPIQPLRGPQSEARAGVGADTPPRVGTADPTLPAKQSQPKYFYYISQTKVDMLLPQLRLGSIRDDSDEVLVTRVLRLIEALHHGNSVESLDDKNDIRASTFYADTAMWHNGLYYFRTAVSVTVAYFLWRKRGSSIIILAGSPDNVIGTRVANHGARLPSTGDAIETIGSSEILELINTDEVSSVVMGRGARTSPGSQPAKKPLSITAGTHETPEEGWFEKYIYTRSREVALAVFCLTRLSDLPEMAIDTVFRVYSTHTSQGANLFEDLEAEVTQRHQEYQPGEYGDSLITADKSRLKGAEKMGLKDLRTIYIGSPLYTAIE